MLAQKLCDIVKSKYKTKVACPLSANANAAASLFHFRRKSRGRKCLDGQDLCKNQLHSIILLPTLRFHSRKKKKLKKMQKFQKIGRTHALALMTIAEWHLSVAQVDVTF
ncbi:unnamed protein product [Ceratitis capitata]|uniref:(Mediterranean fruit fly) hypothetical protein n=1 Tax=Ceratitis capitata TaxID=7213 RepID=A0A811UNG0_CERCA|nr:unnamed protein product [Ceratitis capitata]